MRKNSLQKTALPVLLALCLAASASAGTFKRITIDGSFADWAGVPLSYSDPSETTAGADFRDVYVANDEQYLYIRFTLYTNGTPFTSRNNIFIDADNNSGSGFHPLGIAFGSEMLIQSGTGYQEKSGGFNEGAITGLGWSAAPTASATAFELRISRAATYASDSLPVFAGDTIAILLESENTSFVAVDLAPDTGGISYTFTNPPPPLSGNLQLIPLTGFPWRYDDLGGDWETLWRQPEFNDIENTFRDGTALFGFTTNAAVYPAPIQTPLNPSRTTYYFRSKFEWTNDPSGVVLVASNYLSDGAVFYLNGTEMKRLRLPPAPVLFDTPATGGPAVKGQAELAGFSAGALVIGTNVLAVETHQTAGDTADMVFGLSLLASTQFPVVFTDSAKPTNRTVVAGQTTTFVADVIGSPPLSYQWYKEGEAIPGATNATFTINFVLVSDAGSYLVRVSNSVSTNVPSRAALLTVTGEHVRITDASQPANQTVTEGGSVTFNVAAAGSAPLSYQWFHGSSPIPDATNASYTISSARASDAGGYYVVVSNPVPSSVTSRTAVLTIQADRTPPAVENIVASLDRIIVTFSEPVDEAMAEQTANYTIGGGVNVTAAVRSADNPAEVVLTTSAQTLGAFRCLTVNNVRDLFNNPITPASIPFISTILIDGSFADWAGVPLAHSDAVDQPTATDFRDIYLTNDADHIFVRVTLHSPSDLAIFYNNIFIDSDNNAGTGFPFRIGSEMLIQGGGGYQEKNGGFNEGGINGLDWAISPEGVGTDFEFRFSRHATYESDGKRVFTNDTIAVVFDAENTSFQTVDTAPDSGGLTYVLSQPPTVLGPLSISRDAFGDIIINWPGSATLQTRSSLTSGTWQTLWDGLGPYHAGTPSSQGFYRLLRPCP
jgi:hypothetical protein